MTPILQCLSALTAFLSAESNATKLPGWQPAVICRIPNTRHHDTSIMDLCVLLNKWRNDCHNGRNQLHFYSGRAVRGQSNRAQKVQVCRPQQKMDSYWWWINEEEWNSFKMYTPEGPLRSCQYLLNKTQRGHRPRSLGITQSFRSCVMASGCVTSKSHL